MPEVIKHISATAPAKPSSKHSRLDNEIETIVLKCLAKEPPRRYQSAGELARDLGRYLRGEAIEAKRESAWYVVRKLASRNRAAVVLSGIALAAVIVGGVTSSILYARAESSRRTADSRYEQAKIKTEQTRRMVAFLRDIFESVDPYVAAGVDTSLLEQILEDARLQAATDLKQDPEVQAAVHDMLGVSFGLLNRVKESREELEEGLRLRRAHFGNVSEPVVESMLHLATLDFDAGRRDDSLARCREVQRLLEQLPKSSEELTARRLHVEASVAMGRSEFDRALKLSTEALDIRRRVLPEGDARTLRSEQDLGSALKLAGHFEDAERIFQSLLEEQTRRHGPDHPSVASALLSLGEIAIDRQQLEKAKENLERSLQICRVAYRKPHLNTAMHSRSRSIGIGEAPYIMYLSRE